MSGIAQAAAMQPSLLVDEGGNERTVIIDHTPFTIGRRSSNDLTITDAHVSRDQALITGNGAEFYVEDRGSSFGTFLNGERLTTPRRLQIDDRIAFGGTAAVVLTFCPSKKKTGSHADFLSSFSVVQQPAQTPAAELERLALCLEAARKLNTAGVLDEIVATLVEATLRLTGAERGFVFLRDRAGVLRMAAGRDSRGRELTDESTISHSILQRALNSGTEFVIGDTSEDAQFSMQQSIVAHELRAVICLPLAQHGAEGTIHGVLYLDSHFARRNLTGVGHDLLRAIAAQAAALVENAQLAEAEQTRRRYEQELAISAAIQRGLMNVSIPQVPFATVRGRSIPCREIGGDFFDVVYNGDALSVILADVSGKTVPAALLASILQGLVYAELMSNVDIAEIAAVANRYLCGKELSGKYATMIIARLQQDGTLDLINCGHVPPCLVRQGKLTRIEPTNLPVGLLSEAQYESFQVKLTVGDRIMLVTDGITEAQRAADDFFGEERLEHVACSGSLDEVFAAVDAFRGALPLEDDCTGVELTYH